MGQQERWLLWRPGEEALGQGCYLSDSAVHRWLAAAGQKAQQEIAGQLEGVPSCGQVGTDGLWARFKGSSKKVVLALVDSVSGLIWPPVAVGWQIGLL